MKFCSKCFNDTEIINVINSIDNKGICEITGEYSDHIYDTAKHLHLNEYFEQLLDLYTPISELGQNVHIENEKMVQIKYELLNNTDLNIFSDKCKHSDVYKILKNICNDKYKECPELLDGDVVIEALHNDNYQKEHSLINSYTWEDFTESIKYNNRFYSDHLNKDILERTCEATAKIYKKGAIFYRGRISPKVGLPKTEMGAPPVEKTIEGRVNAAGIRCLYLANNEKTTINEVRAGIFDFITVGKFKLEKDILVVDFRRINKISPFVFALKGLDLTEYILNKPFLNKINAEMAKAVRKSDSKLDYIPTQYICDYIKSIRSKDGFHKFKGVEYNSTLCENGFNLAVFEPNLFECIDTKVYQVQSLNYNTDEIQ